MPNPLCTNPTNLRKRRGVPGGNLIRNVGLGCMSCEDIGIFFQKVKYHSLFRDYNLLNCKLGLAIDISCVSSKFK